MHKDWVRLFARSSVRISVSKNGKIKSFILWAQTTKLKDHDFQPKEITRHTQNKCSQAFRLVFFDRPLCSWGWLCFLAGRCGCEIVVGSLTASSAWKNTISFFKPSLSDKTPSNPVYNFDRDISLKPRNRYWLMNAILLAYRKASKIAEEQVDFQKFASEQHEVHKMAEKEN